jgi:hypothetical protein
MFVVPRTPEFDADDRRAALTPQLTSERLTSERFKLMLA